MLNSPDGVRLEHRQGLPDRSSPTPACRWCRRSSSSARRTCLAAVSRVRPRGGQAVRRRRRARGRGARRDVRRRAASSAPVPGWCSRSSSRCAPRARPRCSSSAVRWSPRPRSGPAAGRDPRARAVRRHDGRGAAHRRGGRPGPSYGRGGGGAARRAARLRPGRPDAPGRRDAGRQRARGDRARALPRGAARTTLPRSPSWSPRGSPTPDASPAPMSARTGSTRPPWGTSALPRRCCLTSWRRWRPRASARLDMLRPTTTVWTSG